MSQDSVIKSILLVEDEALLAMATKMALEDNGYDVVHVSNGEAAIEAVYAGSIDLILMDIDLGRNRMDGTETAEKILQERAIPIIFHTSHSEREMVEKVKGITRYGYVLKSAGEFVLLEAIQMAFELFAAHRQIAEKEERYQHMFDYNRSGVAVLKAVDNGKDFVFVDYNRTAEAVDAVPKEEVIGRRVTVVFPGVEAFGILEVFREVWKTGESKSHTDAFYRDERISGWRESFVYRIPSGEIVSVYRDVTEEKETQNKLQVASHELQCLYEISRLVDTEGRTLPAILQGAVDLLPQYMGETGNMSVRLTIDGTEFVTANFRESPKEERLPIFVRGKEAGELEVFCNRKKSQCIKQIYPEEFAMFLETIPRFIGKTIERFQAVEELQESKEDYRCILESIGDGVITTDLRGRIARANLMARELLGCADADLLDKSLYDAFTLHDGRDGKPLPNPVETVLATDTIITLSNHTKLVSKWGKELQIADSVAPVHDERGGIRGSVLVFRDETAKYEREKLLRESEERYRRLFDTMSEGFIRANSRGEIVLANQAAAELCGYDSVDDLTGRPMTDLYVEPRERSALLTQLKKDRQFRNREFLLKKKNGDTIWTLCNIKMVPDADGDSFGTEALFRDYTDKKSVELEREKHERFIDSILDAIQDPVSVHDIDLNIRKANRVVHAMFPEREKIVGGKCYKAYFGRSAPCAECPILKAFATKKVHSCLKEFPGTGEGKQYFELFAYPIIDDQGNVESVVEYARNITELKSKEEDLVRTKEQLQKMLQVLPEGFVTVNAEGEITYANEAAGKILEVYRDKITGSYYNDRKWKQIDERGNRYPLEELPLALTLRDKTEVHNLVHGIVAPDGETKWLSVNSAPLLDGEGELRGAIASFRDVSEQKKTETALRESEAYYRNVLQFLPVFVLDREYRYLAVNDLAANLVHMKAADLLGKRITDLFPGITETDFYRIYERVMESRQADSITAPFTLPDGEPGLYQVHVLPCPEGVQCVAVDITEQRKAEEAVQQQLKDKELLIRETHHRIKNNMASIAGLLSLQAEATTNSEVRAVLNQATGRVTNMSDLYDKMLSSDDVRVISAAPYINDLVDSILPLFSHRTDVTVEKRIGDFTLDSSKLFILGVIVNELLTNSMKYAFVGRKKGVIRIHCKKAKDRVLLVVEDDGAGLPEGFDVEQASGFGMSLVTLLGRQLEATVTFENENGTRVTVEFSV